MLKEQIILVIIALTIFALCGLEVHAARTLEDKGLCLDQIKYQHKPLVWTEHNNCIEVSK